jgi:hypothetical protein
VAPPGAARATFHPRQLNAHRQPFQSSWRGMVQKRRCNLVLVQCLHRKPPDRRNAKAATGPTDRRHTMNHQTSNRCESTAAFELRFQSLFHEGRALAFPCNAAGAVDLDRLSAKARNNYLYARATIGRDVAVPAVQPSHLH